MYNAVEQHTKFNRKSIDDRQVDGLIGIARGILADGVVSDLEISYLHEYLVQAARTTQSPIVQRIFDVVDSVVEDGVIDEQERKEVTGILNGLIGEGSEVGELLKSSTLPLDNPFPKLKLIESTEFCFTGKFCYGSRRECMKIVEEMGMRTTQTLRKRTTDYLVVGHYATDSWIHESYGRKIENAVDWKEYEDHPIKVISEYHWADSLGLLSGKLVKVDKEPEWDGKGSVFVITGTLSVPREVIADEIARLGGKVSRAVRKETDYLVVGEKPRSAKLEKANEFGVRCMSETELQKYMKEFKKLKS